MTATVSILKLAPHGGKWWRFKYRFGGKDKRISMGVYPEVTRKDTRDAVQEARRMVREGLDPSVQKRRAAVNAIRTFRSVGEEWRAKQELQWTLHHQEATRSRLERLVYPRMSILPIDGVTPQDVLGTCRAVETGTSVYMSHVILSLVGRIMRYAVASGYIPSDPCRDFTGALTPHQYRAYACHHRSYAGRTLGCRH